MKPSVRRQPSRRIARPRSNGVVVLRVVRPCPNWGLRRESPSKQSPPRDDRERTLGPLPIVTFPSSSIPFRFLPVLHGSTLVRSWGTMEHSRLECSSCVSISDELLSTIPSAGAWMVSSLLAAVRMLSAFDSAPADPTTGNASSGACLRGSLHGFLRRGHRVRSPKVPHLLQYRVESWFCHCTEGIEVRAFSSSFFIVGAIGVIGCTQTVEPPEGAFARRERQDFRLSVGKCIVARGVTCALCPDSDDALGDDEERHTPGSHYANRTRGSRGRRYASRRRGARSRSVRTRYGTPDCWRHAHGHCFDAGWNGDVRLVLVKQGRYSIFALPTTCVTPPKEGQPAREITLWSSCRLPSAPGEMAIAVDPTQTVTVDKNKKEITSYRTHLRACLQPPIGLPPANLAITKRREDCPANLEAEQQTAPIGRRKLVVTPARDEGKIAIFDAQAILKPAAGFL